MKVCHRTVGLGVKGSCSFVYTAVFEANLRTRHRDMRPPRWSLQRAIKYIDPVDGEIFATSYDERQEMGVVCGQLVKRSIQECV